VLTACALFVADLTTSSFNPTILYTIVVYVLACRLSGRWALGAASVLAVTTYGGLFLGVRPPGLETASEILRNYRFVNRSFCATAILLTAAVTVWRVRWAKRIDKDLEGDESFLSHSMYQDQVDQVQFLATVLMALSITGAIIGIDWTTSNEFNLPILYVVPLVLCVMSDSRGAIISMTPLLLALTWIGFWASPNLLSGESLPSVVNRMIASAVLLALAGLGLWQTRRQPR